MKIERLISVPMRLLTLWASAARDLDTFPTRRNTIWLLGAEVTTVLASIARHLSPPTYLPAWGVVFPGARLRKKSVQRRYGLVIGRGTSYSTEADFAEVVLFYDDYYRGQGIVPTGQFEAKYGKIYQFDFKRGYQSLLNIQNLAGKSGSSKVEITIAQTAAC